jgi:hypothetical protein
MLNIKTFLHKEYSRYFVSVILGLGLAALFKRVCKDGKCLEFETPPMKEMKDNLYKYGDQCYKYNITSSLCDAHKKNVSFNNNNNNNNVI